MNAKPFNRSAIAWLHASVAIAGTLHVPANHNHHHAPRGVPMMQTALALSSWQGRYRGGARGLLTIEVVGIARRCNVDPEDLYAEIWRTPTRKAAKEHAA